MKVAFVGTRGIPARYGGFETAVEELATRFVEHGFECVVYCRNGDPSVTEFRGVELVHLPAVRRKSVETLLHSFVSVLHVLRRPVDVVLLFNGANAVFIPLLRLRRIPAAVHVDGLEWKRAKWSGLARRWHLIGERLAVRFADAVVADAPGIARYYRQRHDADTVELTYGANVLEDPGSDLLGDLGLEPDGYHLVVARFEPENHIPMIIEGFVASCATMPLVVVGREEFGESHTAEVRAAAGDDPRVRFIGAVWFQEQLDQLYANARTYLHGHSVGGTNPSLLRAMGAGVATVMYDVEFNRDVAGDAGRYFASPDDVAKELEAAEADPAAARERGDAGRRRIAEAYRWDDVVLGYERLCSDLFGTRVRP